MDEFWRSMHEWIRTIVEIGLLVVTIVGVCLVLSQLRQANEHQRWSNYNQLNIHYSNWYSGLPPAAEDPCTKLDALDASDRRWIRSYFNLYSEQHYLYLEKFIPDEMWTRRISGGVDVNLRAYPVLIEGYEYWKGKNAFRHPVGFREMVEEKIASALPEVLAARVDCT